MSELKTLSITTVTVNDQIRIRNFFPKREIFKLFGFRSSRAFELFIGEEGKKILEWKDGKQSFSARKVRVLKKFIEYKYKNIANDYVVEIQVVDKNIVEPVKKFVVEDIRDLIAYNKRDLVRLFKLKTIPDLQRHIGERGIKLLSWIAGEQVFDEKQVKKLIELVGMPKDKKRTIII